MTLLFYREFLLIFSNYSIIKFISLNLVLPIKFLYKLFHHANYAEFIFHAALFYLHDMIHYQRSIINSTIRGIQGLVKHLQNTEYLYYVAQSV